MHTATLRDRLRYSFDTSLSRGPIALIGWLALATAVVIFVIALVDWGAGFAPDDDGSIHTLLWMNLMRLLDGVKRLRGGRMTTDFDVRTLTISRSLTSIVLPRRQTIRVLPVEPTMSRSSSSISILSRSARIAIVDRFWFSFAIRSSETIAKICSDQPRMTV